MVVIHRALAFVGARIKAGFATRKDFAAAIRAEEVTRRISAHFIDRLFEGSLSDMMAHLLTTRQISREELARLESLIAERKKKP